MVGAMADVYRVCNVARWLQPHPYSIDGDSMQRTKLTVLLAVLAAGLTQVTLANTTDGQPLSRHVDYSDLNLAQPAGARVLYQRLVTAAGIVCEPYDGRELVRVTYHTSCVHEAISAAVADINSPLLTSYYVSRGGERPQQVAQLSK
jgi:UrcA family protein